MGRGVEARIEGSDEFRLAGARIKAAGNKDLKGRVNKAIKQAMDPAAAEVRSHIKALKFQESPAAVKKAAGQGPSAATVARAARTAEKRKASIAKTAEKSGRSHQQIHAEVLAKILGKGKSGLRESIAAAVKVSVTANDVTVKISKTALPADQQSLPRAIEKGKWRHPVFGRKVFVTQTAKPFFYGTLNARKDEFRSAIVEAVNTIIKEIH